VCFSSSTSCSSVVIWNSFFDFENKFWTSVLTFLSNHEYGDFSILMSVIYLYLFCAWVCHVVCFHADTTKPLKCLWSSNLPSNLCKKLSVWICCFLEFNLCLLAYLTCILLEGADWALEGMARWSLPFKIHWRHGCWWIHCAYTPREADQSEMIMLSPRNFFLVFSIGWQGIPYQQTFCFAVNVALCHLWEIFFQNEFFCFSDSVTGIFQKPRVFLFVSHQTLVSMCNIMQMQSVWRRELDLVILQWPWTTSYDTCRFGVVPRV
jgi:hypothetical protein